VQIDASYAAYDEHPFDEPMPGGTSLPSVRRPAGDSVLQLLRSLAGAGAELRYAGDLDGDGVRIAAHADTPPGAIRQRAAGQGPRS
jgi:hypothetical protein